MINNFKKYLFLLLWFFGTIKTMSTTHAVKNVDYYKILNATTKANTETITHNFNVLYRKYYRCLVSNKEDIETHEVFRNIVIAYMVLTNPDWRKSYDIDPAHCEEPYHFYNLLGVTLRIPENNENHNITPPAWVNPSTITEFYTRITETEIAKSFLNSREEDIFEAYLYLSDRETRSLYDANPIQSSFMNKLQALQPTTEKEAQSPVEERVYKTPKIKRISVVIQKLKKSNSFRALSWTLPNKKDS